MLYRIKGSGTLTTEKKNFSLPKIVLYKSYQTYSEFLNLEVALHTTSP